LKERPTAKKVDHQGGGEREADFLKKM